MTYKNKTSKHGFFDYPLPIAFAHRGGDERYPENTLAAFKDAYELGYRYFETDVHYTIDKELIAFHDKDLSRTIGLNGTIASLTKAKRMELKRHKTYEIPLLNTLLKEFPDVYFHIDAKSRAAVKPLVDAVIKYRAEDRVCLASFSPTNIKQLRKLLPDVPTIATRSEIARFRYGLPPVKLPDIHSRNLAVPIKILYNRNRITLIDKQSVAKLHDKHCKVYIWTINDEDQMHYLLDIGVDGIISDKLRLLKSVLIDRGQWINPE